MFQQILSHTPIWVWVLLAVLFVRGLKMTVDRDTSTRALVLLPLLMLAWSLSGLIGQADQHPGVLLVWLAGAALTLGCAARFGRPDAMQWLGQGQVRVRGSWLPLTVMMVIFCVQYLKNMLFAIQPELRSALVFNAVVALISGLLNGLLLARLLNLLRLWQAASGKGMAKLY